MLELRRPASPAPTNRNMGVMQQLGIIEQVVSLLVLFKSSSAQKTVTGKFTALQLEVDQALAHPPASLSMAQMKTMLTPYDRCLLDESKQRFSYSTRIDTKSPKELSVEIIERAAKLRDACKSFVPSTEGSQMPLSDRKPHPTKASYRQCALGGYMDSCLHQPNLALFQRHGLLRRFTSGPVASLRTSPSHLLSIVRALDKKSQQLTIYGDSVSEQMAYSARCDLLRNDPSNEYQSVVAYESFLGDVSVIKPPPGVVVVNFGLHDHKRKGPNGDEEYRSKVTKVLQELEAFGAIPGNLAVFRLTTPKFFPHSPDGSYETAALLKPFKGFYQCANPPNQSAESDWRNNAVRGVVSELELKNVLIVPTTWMHGLFAIMQGDRPQHVLCDNNDPQVSDCTHFCQGPYLWEPLWWAVRTAREAYTEGTEDPDRGPRASTN